jgi:hypothetical protein
MLWWNDDGQIRFRGPLNILITDIGKRGKCRRYVQITVFGLTISIRIKKEG